MNGHTEGKWKVKDARDLGIYAGDLKIATIHNNGKARLASDYDEEQANAAFIVRAVNYHAELLEALETLNIYAEAFTKRVEFYNKRESLNIFAASMPELKTALKQARGALEAARGGEKMKVGTQEEAGKTAHCSGCGKPCEIIHDLELSVCCLDRVVWKKEGSK